MKLCTETVLMRTLYGNWVLTAHTCLVRRRLPEHCERYRRTITAYYMMVAIFGKSDIDIRALE